MVKIEVIRKTQDVVGLTIVADEPVDKQILEICNAATHTIVANLDAVDVDATVTHKLVVDDVVHTREV